MVRISCNNEGVYQYSDWDNISMRFNFKKFSDPDSSYDAKISIRRTGQFGFNAGAVNKYNLDEYPFVALYYDAAQRVVGIELLKERENGAIELNRNPSNYFVRAKNFCDRFGIDYSHAARYSLYRDDESGFLYFQLVEPEEGEENASDE